MTKPMLIGAAFPCLQIIFSPGRSFDNGVEDLMTEIGLIAVRDATAADMHEVQSIYAHHVAHGSPRSKRRLHPLTSC